MLSVPAKAESFHDKWMFDFVSAFSEPIEMIIWFLVGNTMNYSDWFF